ncbi:E3 ubiquitin-protein ligase FANCL [Galleria mellonella]|uniref:E3 ubiquitin-protein ligase FANCL n=1 Tax=Galleria mellonella TaxID=7137 RepID=A0A6J1X151_GALME|nr:E3 ubiquitin-protein ligase FANCL [Galleria mellonella]
MDSLIQELLNSEKCKSLPVFLDRLHVLLQSNIEIESISSFLIDKDFLDEVKNLVAHGSIPLFFGKSLKDLKCIVQDNENRKHELYFHYNGPRKLSITSVYLPYSTIQDQEYNCIEDIIVAFKKRLSYLNKYFKELENIDSLCTVVEPVNRTFKDDYRVISLDNKTWLHVEVTPEGMGNNVRLLGKGREWSEKLQNKLLLWDHDTNVVENIMTLFDVINYAAPSYQESSSQKVIEKVPICNICLSAQLPNSSEVPQSFCSNSNCGVYFHRNCLCQWLTVSNSGRNTDFGIATGKCPSCFQLISCIGKEG